MRILKQSLKCIFLLFCLLGSFLSRASDVSDELKQLTEDWNSLHNTRDISGFQNLYAGQVLFYGKYRSGSYCIEQKAKFLNEDFSQKIVSPIMVQFYSSGTAKCSFTKEVTYKNSVKTHQCYLLFKQENGEYHITGESDLQTDQNLHVQLDLGAELSTPLDERHTGRYIIMGLMVIIGAGSLRIYKRKSSKKHQEEELSQYYVSASEPAPALLSESFKQSATVDPQIKRSSSLEQQTAILQDEPKLSDKEKGDAFEKYVLSHFDLTSDRFRIIEWRGDKITDDGHYALSNHHPDIVLELKKSTGSYRFAVECKWRSEYQNGSIEWAKEYQIRNYQSYQKQMQIPVFIVIGVGGIPSAPKYLHVAQLDQIAKYSVLFQTTLKKYNKFVPSSFFYDPDQNTLK